MLTKEYIGREKRKMERIKEEVTIFLKKNRPNYYTSEEVTEAVFGGKDLVESALFDCSLKIFSRVRSERIIEKSGLFKYYYTYR